MTDEAAKGRLRDKCCEGVPSGYITPDGVHARMCDDACSCDECRIQHTA